MNATPNTWKATLALGDIKPSEDNPRQDFGDIAALADRIRATGGQPINPIVCVKDGEAYRIVDGERRYRALLEIYGEEGTTTALVFPDYSEAHAAVAMLATDDKKQLSKEEQARGFQTMMRLDVPMADVMHATGIGADDLHRARRSMAAAARMADGAQATMDAMIVAGGEEFSEDERAKILASDWPDSEAADILKSHRRAAKLEAIRCALPDGVEFGEPDADRSGLHLVCEAKSAKAAREFEPEDGKGYVALPPRYEGYPPSWTIYERLPEGVIAADVADAERDEAEREREMHEATMDALRWHWASWLADHWLDDLKPLEEAVVQDRRMPDDFEVVFDMDQSTWPEEMRRGAVTGWDLLCWLNDRVHYATPWPRWGQPDQATLAKILRVWDVMAACGWEPEGNDDLVRMACAKE